VAELGVQYLRWAESYYVKDGEPTTELVNVKRSLRALRESFPDLSAREFGPVALKVVRERLVADGLSRVNCNRFTRIIVRVFKFAAENQMIPGDLPAGLACVKPFARGRGCLAHETDPVLPVDEETINDTLPALNEKYRAMVQIQLLLACRPGELVTMRTGEIDRSGPIWVYRPKSHKTEHHGKSRIIPIGPKCQLLLAPWLQADCGTREQPGFASKTTSTGHR
jgi:integrase